ncbi:unnamed protein product [Trichogramma brassicae]|uniref:Uncharacterized protein n=1 Tax=Trichogramma brassicae TaxID=86971 RepID=A0A6H5IV13_9HYME|nr:unnamed protein product [Trichogramma brassicae]
MARISILAHRARARRACSAAAASPASVARWPVGLVETDGIYMICRSPNRRDNAVPTFPLLIINTTYIINPLNFVTYITLYAQSDHFWTTFIAMNYTD